MIDVLSEYQQDLFSMVASSNAKQTSGAYIEGKHMEKVFVAMAEKSRVIDPDGNEVITAGELANFLNVAVRAGRGDLVYARSSDEPIFGLSKIANLLPIIDLTEPEREYPKNYIPLPRL